MYNQSGRLQGAGCAISRGADRVQFATVQLTINQTERLGDGVTRIRQRRTEAGDINRFKSCSSRFTDAGAGLPTGSHFGFSRTGTPLNEAQIAKCADYLCLASTVPSDAQAAFLGVFKTATDDRLSCDSVHIRQQVAEYQPKEIEMFWILHLLALFLFPIALVVTIPLHIINESIKARSTK